ncbi:MAG: DUF4386 domain-containing protein [Gemmatimonadota bacterium]|nr:DUF4386 domain-containing protein [Gemmatimonadota bacterium]
MTRTTNARLAGFTFLFYIAAGITSLILGDEAAATSVLSVLTSLCALLLGVTLYAITRVQDPDLALLGLTCRIVEGIPGVQGEIFFAIGSTLFAWLLLRGRMIPVALAQFGVAASVLLVVLLLLQRGEVVADAGGWSSVATWLMWLPMAAFEITLAFWFLIKGVAAPAPDPT